MAIAAYELSHAFKPTTTLVVKSLDGLLKHRRCSVMVSTTLTVLFVGEKKEAFL